MEGNIVTLIDDREFLVVVDKRGYGLLNLKTFTIDYSFQNEAEMFNNLKVVGIISVKAKQKCSYSGNWREQIVFKFQENFFPVIHPPILPPKYRLNRSPWFEQEGQANPLSARRRHSKSVRCTRAHTQCGKIYYNT